VLADRSGKHSAEELRSYQDWTLRYALQSVPGVAEVASIGGFQKQYQITVDPNRLAAYGLSLDMVMEAVRDSNNEVGGRRSWRSVRRSSSRCWSSPWPSCRSSSSSARRGGSSSCSALTPRPASPRYFTTTLGLNRSRFTGDIGYTSLGVAYDTSALKPITLQLVYNYTGRNNESSIVKYTNLTTGESIESELFEYFKHHAGVSLGMKLPWQTTLNVGYDFSKVDRKERTDAENRKDHDISIRLRNSASDLLTTRVKYQHVFRSSESGIEASDFAPKDPAPIELYERRFDVADKDRDVAGIAFDLTPTDALDLGLAYTYTRDDYDSTELGLQKETRHEIYLVLSYKLPRAVIVGASAGYERVDSDQRERQYSPGGNTDPASANTPTAFNWSEKLGSSNWSYGLSAKVPVVKGKLDLAATWTPRNQMGRDSSPRREKPLTTSMPPMTTPRTPWRSRRSTTWQSSSR